MTDYTVKQSGGDYTTLDAAIGGSSVVNISIEGTWTADDTTPVTLDVANVSITCDADSKHPGYLIEETRTGSTTHYRHVYGGSSDNVDVNSSGCTIADIAFISTSSTDSQEVIDYQGADVDIDSCVIHCTNGDTVSNKDGVYTALTGRTLNIDNCIITGFSRCGIHVQSYGGGSGTHTANIDSCTIFSNGLDGGVNSGGIGAQANGTTVNMVIDNTVVLGNNTGSATDFTEAFSPNWAVNYVIYNNDGSVTFDSGGNNLGSRTETDSDTPGTGDWVVFEDVTTAPYDLRLKTNAENDAEDSGATTLIEDIVGTSRPQTTDDRGAFEISSAATEYTLTSASGSYSLTGTASDLKSDKKLSSSTASYSISGTAADLSYGYILDAATDSYAISGTATALLTARNLSAATAGYALTGTATALLTARNLSAATDSYAISGTAATVIYSALTEYNLTAESGSYLTAGTNNKFSFAVTYDAGNYAVVGTAADLLADRIVDASTTSLDITGTANSLDYSPLNAYSFSADSGTIGLFGAGTLLVDPDTGDFIVDTNGDFIVVSPPVELLADRIIGADTTSLDVTGTANELTYAPLGAYILPAESGTISITGTTVEFPKTSILAANTANYEISGTALSVDYGYTLEAAAGSIELTGTAASLIASRLLAAATDSLDITGTSVAFTFSGALVEPTPDCRTLTVYSENRTLTITESRLITITAENRIIDAEIAC